MIVGTKRYSKIYVTHRDASEQGLADDSPALHGHLLIQQWYLLTVQHCLVWFRAHSNFMLGIQRPACMVHDMLKATDVSPETINQNCRSSQAKL